MEIIFIKFFIIINLIQSKNFYLSNTNQILINQKFYYSNFNYLFDFQDSYLSFKINFKLFLLNLNFIKNLMFI